MGCVHSTPHPAVPSDARPQEQPNARTDSLKPSTSNGGSAPSSPDLSHKQTVAQLEQQLAALKKQQKEAKHLATQQKIQSLRSKSANTKRGGGGGGTGSSGGLAPPRRQSSGEHSPKRTSPRLASLIASTTSDSSTDVNSTTQSEDEQGERHRTHAGARISALRLPAAAHAQGPEPVRMQQAADDWVLVTTTGSTAPTVGLVNEDVKEETEAEAQAEEQAEAEGETDDESNPGAKVSKEASSQDDYYTSDDAYKQKPKPKAKPKPYKLQWKMCDTCLGSGAYGQVFMALNLDNGQLMAVKRVALDEKALSQIGDPRVEALKREIDVMRQLSNRHIVKYLGVEAEEKFLNIFLEFVPGGSIAAMLKKFGSFNEKLVRKYTRQLLLGLEYLHRHQIVHRDIKGGNILVDINGVCKVADFGASSRLADLSKEKPTLQGTPYWMAPEVIKQQGHGRKVDIWSVGCTVIEMYTGKPPWHRLTQFAVLYHIGNTNDPPELPETISQDGRDFILQCLERDPKKRPTASKLLQHPFVSEMAEEDSPRSSSRSSRHRHRHHRHKRRAKLSRSNSNSKVNNTDIANPGGNEVAVPVRHSTGSGSGTGSGTGSGSATANNSGVEHSSWEAQASSLSQGSGHPGSDSNSDSYFSYQKGATVDNKDAVVTATDAAGTASTASGIANASGTANAAVPLSTSTSAVLAPMSTSTSNSSIFSRSGGPGAAWAPRGSGSTASATAAEDRVTALLAPSPRTLQVPSSAPTAAAPLSPGSSPRNSLFDTPAAEKGHSHAPATVENQVASQSSNVLLLQHPHHHYHTRAVSSPSAPLKLPLNARAATDSSVPSSIRCHSDCDSVAVPSHAVLSKSNSWSKQHELRISATPSRRSAADASNATAAAAAAAAPVAAEAVAVPPSAVNFRPIDSKYAVPANFVQPSEDDLDHDHLTLLGRTTPISGSRSANELHSDDPDVVAPGSATNRRRSLSTSPSHRHRVLASTTDTGADECMVLQFLHQNYMSVLGALQGSFDTPMAGAFVTSAGDGTDASASATPVSTEVNSASTTDQRLFRTQSS